MSAACLLTGIKCNVLPGHVGSRDQSILMTPQYGMAILQEAVAVSLARFVYFGYGLRLRIVHVANS